MTSRTVVPAPAPAGDRSPEKRGVAPYVISDSCRQDPAAGKASKLGTSGFPSIEAAERVCVCDALERFGLVPARERSAGTR